MNRDSEHLACRFDTFCKRLLKHAVIDAIREQKRLGQWETTFSELTRAEQNQLQYIEQYAPDRRVFPLLGMEVEVLDAKTVIRNHLLNCCKSINTRQRNLPAVSLDVDYTADDGPPPFAEPYTPDGVDELLGRMDTADLLADCKRRYTGVARLGVEAMEWKVKGLSGADIARLYGAKPNQVGAWISRAAQKIRKDIVENRLPHL